MSNVGSFFLGFGFVAATIGLIVGMTAASVYFKVDASFAGLGFATGLFAMFVAVFIASKTLW